MKQRSPTENGSDSYLCWEKFQFQNFSSIFLSITELNRNDWDIIPLQTEAICPRARCSVGKAAPAESDSCFGWSKLEVPKEKTDLSDVNCVRNVKCV